MAPHSKGYYHEASLFEISDAPLFEHFFDKLNEIARWTPWVNIVWEIVLFFLPSSQMLIKTSEVRFKKSVAWLVFSKIGDNPIIFLGIVDCWLYTRRVALKSDHLKETMQTLAHIPVRCRKLETLAKIFTASATQENSFIKTLFNNAAAHWNANPMKKKTPFAGSSKTFSPATTFSYLTTNSGQKVTAKCRFSCCFWDLAKF